MLKFEDLTEGNEYKITAPDGESVIAKYHGKSKIGSHILEEIDGLEFVMYDSDVWEGWVIEEV